MEGLLRAGSRHGADEDELSLSVRCPEQGGRGAGARGAVSAGAGRGRGTRPSARRRPTPGSGSGREEGPSCRPRPPGPGVLPAPVRAHAWPREPDPGGSAGPGRVRLCAREHAVAARPPKGLSQGSTSQRREPLGPGPSQTPPVQPGSELTGRKAETQPPSPGAGRRALSGSPGSAPSQRGPGLQLGSSARPSAPCRSAHLPFFPLGLPRRRSAAAGEPPRQPHPAREPGATESTGGGGQAGPGGRGGGPPWGVLTSSGGVWTRVQLVRQGWGQRCIGREAQVGSGVSAACALVPENLGRSLPSLLLTCPCWGVSRGTLCLRRLAGQRCWPGLC